ncbi:glycoside hydrolase family 57 protein [Candidatus Saccharibacteria bacterium]|nr:glycoside hydrolase family 57 protein [Candidatus Saccharibacteria bacterium]
MRAICLYLHIHQPWRYRRYSIFDVAHNHNYWYEKDYYDKQNNERIFRKVAKKSYHPMLDLIERNIKRYPGFKVSLSITGTWLEQALEWEPSLVEQIRRLVSTGQIEIVGETYYHSLAFFYNRDEFNNQVKMHSDVIAKIFGVRPRVFRNTEFAYNDELGKWADEIGYSAVLAEGWDKVLGWRSPNHVYKVPGASRTKLLLKNYRLSDDIAFRFSDRNWKEWPLTVDKYQNWLNMDSLRGNLINLFMDFETFGENIWQDTGIFEFMDSLIYSWLKEYDNKFVTVSEACKIEEPVDELSMPETVTWADTERDLSAWLGNEMQHEAENTLYTMRPDIIASGDADLISDWRRLTTSDHPYYMCTKYWNDGDVHAYFSPFDSPFDAFMYYMNVVRDFEWRLQNLKSFHS